MGAANGYADLEVLLQGMEKDYDYPTLCSQVEVFAFKAKADAEAEKAAAEKRQIELEEKTCVQQPKHLHRSSLDGMIQVWK
jgi:beta-galactosidase beta subunit